jgi:hypothetical protein
MPRDGGLAEWEGAKDAISGSTGSSEIASPGFTTMSWPSAGRRGTIRVLDARSGPGCQPQTIPHAGRPHTLLRADAGKRGLAHQVDDAWARDLVSRCQAPDQMRHEAEAESSARHEMPSECLQPHAPRPMPAPVGGMSWSSGPRMHRPLCAHLPADGRGTCSGSAPSQRSSARYLNSPTPARFLSRSTGRVRGKSAS